MQLVIAEKPSVAQSIAGVLGATERKDGYMEILKSCCTEMQQLFSRNHLFKCMVFTPHQSKEVVFRP